MLISLDQLEETTWRAGERGHERTLAQLLRWAEQAEDGSEITRAELLVAASDQAGFVGDLDRRIALCRQAVADGSTAHPDARCYLLAALLDAGQHDEATSLVQDLVGVPDRHVHVDEFVGESLEKAGRYLEAAAVFTAGHRRTETQAPDDALMLLHGRRRCREALGRSTDDLDRRSLAALRRYAQPDGGRLEPLPGEPEREVFVFWPPSAWDDAPDRLTMSFPTFAEQRAFVERELRASTEGLLRVTVELDAGGVRALAGLRGASPDDPDVRLEHGMALVRAGRGRPWPPGRNEPCWCGASAKYKKCCGGPAR